MRYLVAIGMAFFAAATVYSQDVPDETSKGTIGLVCLDSAGVYHFWNAKQNGEFQSCVDHVVETWATKNASTPASSSTEELIQGMATYRQAVERVDSARVMERK